MVYGLALMTGLSMAYPCVQQTFSVLWLVKDGGGEGSLVSSPGLVASPPHGVTSHMGDVCDNDTVCCGRGGGRKEATAGGCAQAPNVVLLLEYGDVLAAGGGRAWAEGRERAPPPGRYPSRARNVAHEMLAGPAPTSAMRAR